MNYMNFNIYDLTDYLGSRKQARSKVAYLRLNNVGRLKQVTTKMNNRLGVPINQYRLMAYFTPEEVLSHIDKIVLEHKLDPFYIPKKQYEEAWQSYIDIANYFKEK